MSQSIDELNRKTMAALVKKFGSQSAAEDAFRRLGAGELSRIVEEQGYAEGGKVAKSAPPPLDINKAIKEAGAEDIAPVVHGVYHMESGANRADTSKPNSSGARGPMQVLESTFNQMKEEGRIPKWYKWANPYHNLVGGISYLAYLRDHFGTKNERVLSAGFYGGPGVVKDPTNGTIVEGRKNPRRPNDPTVGQYADKVSTYIKDKFPSYMAKPSPGPVATPPAPAPVPKKEHWWEGHPEYFPISSTDAPQQPEDEDITMPAEYSPGGRERLI